ncbi:MAG: ribonuclease H family protein [Candidatus Sungbacteria bacterium]|nr:ribonuclease H family protein [Candidatus Sungbacteria bacterium]
MTTKKYYAYFVPRTNKNGVTADWKECEKIIKGERGAKFKSFKTKAEAEKWLEQGADYGAKIQKPWLAAGIYFDAGTGRGEGVEVSVTDEKGNGLLNKILPGPEINRHGKHLVRGNVTNNFGELLACKYALEIALKHDAKKVFGDSKLVIDYWSKGIAKGMATPTIPSLPSAKKSLPKETIELVRTVAKLRKNFESKGGSIKHIPGEDNPADLGFHK